ncbi:MAG: hypothetical protein AABZ08_13600 [Planctomycetota bacterium]
MNQLTAIAKNTCLQTMRQPVYGLIVLVTLFGFVLLPALTGWTLDDDNKMLRDMGLSTLLMQGLILAVFAASSVLDAEIEDKTVMTVAAKPVSRYVFILGKFIGVVLAVTASHYVAAIAFMMMMRHGVMQTAADTMDTTVLTFGLGFGLLAIITATVLNILYEKRFLATIVLVVLPLFTLGGATLLFINKEWKFEGYVTKQSVFNLPADLIKGPGFKGLVEFQPDPENSFIEGHNGHLVRSNWKGPINAEDQDYLLSLSTSQEWKKQVNFLVQECRKVEGPELIKAIVLILFALVMIGSMALAAATRFGAMATFLAAILGLGVGLSTDQVLKPYITENAFARVLYPLVPNFQFFWVLDALADERVIPWSFIGSAGIYLVLYSAAFVALAAALFETREVG